mmetsp:Transcript_1068/g.4371  ORF Transcript_1068/g.4371 Transcript_1068/m.4371 type:complete len:231 (+) Transcript_1068:1243-1935(+)
MLQLRQVSNLGGQRLQLILGDQQRFERRELSNRLRESLQAVPRQYEPSQKEARANLLWHAGNLVATEVQSLHRGERADNLGHGAGHVAALEVQFHDAAVFEIHAFPLARVLLMHVALTGPPMHSCGIHRPRQRVQRVEIFRPNTLEPAGGTELARIPTLRRPFGMALEPRLDAPARDPVDDRARVVQRRARYRIHDGCAARCAGSSLSEVRPDGFSLVRLPRVHDERGIS